MWHLQYFYFYILLLNQNCSSRLPLGLDQRRQLLTHNEMSVRKSLFWSPSVRQARHAMRYCQWLWSTVSVETCQILSVFWKQYKRFVISIGWQWIGGCSIILALTAERFPFDQHLIQRQHGLAWKPRILQPASMCLLPGGQMTVMRFK